MTVRELIEALSKLNPDASVCYTYESGGMTDAGTWLSDHNEVEVVRVIDLESRVILQPESD